jgi:hypothetical protein
MVTKIKMVEGTGIGFTLFRRVCAVFENRLP